MDPESLVQCPFDGSHRVRASRLPYHLVRCERNHPQLARSLATCPFNARHRVPQPELRRHVTECPDRRHEMELPPLKSSQQPEVPWKAPPCQEDWEAELSGLEDPEPFILNPCSKELLLPWDSSPPAAPRSRHRVAGPPRGGPGAKRDPGPPQHRGGTPRDAGGGPPLFNGVHQ
ncbi:gametocyte-specific factor 1 [Melopsittacus undulatus]|uniref:gametocyte-specific factor 1 n=1 Tax=Melopsittacus undulatus TaxID=13146 RepID=UPI00146C1495|nr:gametocyte-specific factor 1 [Melopsittacus undulatus]XP_033927450.1 gametocyte-specific factor 1 [Melopsittacus undulatus]XP_033927452.1 gametocyte-specific factor 1 [Melopsittacus undulatus]